MADSRIRWTDERLDDRQRNVDRQLDEIRDELTPLKAVPQAVGVLAMQVDNLAGAVKDIVKEQREDRKQRAREAAQVSKDQRAFRLPIYVAAVGALGTLGAALIGKLPLA